MEREARYFLVGLLLLISMAGGITFAVWSANVTDEDNTRAYQVHFRSAVSGLSTGSNVYYLGVPVGRVSRLELGGAELGGVVVRIAVWPETPVHAQTTAQLSTSGLTGQSSVELSNPEDLAPGSDLLPENSLIPGSASVIGQLAKAAPRIANQTDQALVRMNALLSDENLQYLTAMLRNMATAAQEFDVAARDMQTLLGEMRQSNAEFQAVLPTFKAMASNFDELGDEVRSRTIPEFEATSRELRDTSQLIARQMTDNSTAFREFIADSRLSMYVIRDQILQTAQKAEQFTEELRSNPSRLIYRPRQNGLEFDE